MAAAPLTSTPDVIIEQADTVWAGRFSVEAVTFRHRRFEGGWSAPRRWELFRRGRAAALLPYDPWTDQVVVIEQFRLPALAAGVEPVMIEIPAGLCDGEETGETTARRETVEEMALEADLVEQIADVVLTPGGSDERCLMYVGRVRSPPVDLNGIGRTGGLASEGEDIRVRVIPALEAIESAVAGRFNNSVTLIALLWLAARRDRLRAAWLA